MRMREQQRAARTLAVLSVLVALGVVMPGAGRTHISAPAAHRDSQQLVAQLLQASAFLFAVATQFNGAPQLEAAPDPGGESISIAPDDSTVSGPQGSVVYIVYTLTRLGGYSGDVGFAVTGLPAGVTGAFSDATLTGSEATTTLALTIAGGASLVTNDAFVVTASGAGVDPATDNGTVTVTAASGDTPDWELLYDFEEGTDGVKVPSLFNLSKYSTEKAQTGSKSCKMSILSGTEGWPDFGGAITFPSTVAKGDTLWFDIWLWVPANPTFIINTSPNGSLKFYRAHHQTAGGANNYYFDIQIQDDVGRPTQFRMIKETNETNWIEFGTVGSLTRNAWQRFSVCQKYDNVLQGSGGTSRTRVWLNGNLLVDDATAPVLSNATDVSDHFYLFTYWNGNAPQDQSLWVDNMRFAKNGTPTWALGLEGVS
jgi:hypothetical protein